MASSGFIADFGKRPTGFKLAVFAGVAVVCGLLYYQFSYSKLKSDLDAADDQHASLVGAEAKLKKDEQDYADLEKQVEALKATLDQDDTALPTAAQLPAFFDMLNRKMSEAGVEVRSWNNETQVPVDETIDKVPVTISVAGSFYQLEKLFYLLYKVNQKEGDEGTPAPGAAPVSDQEKDRVLTIEDLSIGDAAVKNNQLILTATFRASTFRKEEPPPAAAPAAGAAKPGAPGAAAGSGSASGSSSASGGGGLLNAPQDAKTKTDAAMQKDADRVKGGM